MPSRPLWSAIATLAFLAIPAGAADDAPTPPARPLLEKLSEETQAACQNLRQGVLRVQLPPPRWMDDVARQDSPLDKYKGLDPKVREQLERRRARAADAEFLARADNAVPTSRAAADTDVKLAANAAVIIVPPPSASTSQPPAPDASATSIEPNNVALVLDRQGHLLVPLYLEREAVSGKPLRLVDNAGATLEADLVGCDRPTNLTVLRLKRPAGAPVRSSNQERPQEGSLALCVMPLDASVRLQVWSSNSRDYGVVFSVAGEFEGVARFGRFLSAHSCRLIAEQIIRHGSVRRATLGVIITEIPRTDPARQDLASLGNRPAVRIDQVMPGSAAEKSGLQVGDLLLALAGQPLGDIPALAAAIAAREGPTELRLLRRGNELTVTVELQQKE